MTVELQPGDLIIRLIPSENQAYPTAGNYRTLPVEGGTVELFEISKMEPDTYSYCIAAHEFIEWIVNRATGVSNAVVDKWDLQVHPESDDPGDEDHCPYAQGHSAGVAVERLICAILNIPWAQYEDAVVAATPES